jgi:hypothetical protein
MHLREAGDVSSGPREAPMLSKKATFAIELAFLTL